MIYGIDFDGTIVNTSVTKVDWIKENLGIDIPAWKTDRTSCVPIIGEDNYNTLIKIAIDRESTLQSPEVPGAFSAVRELSKKGELYVVTARPIQYLEYAKERLVKEGVWELFSRMESMRQSDGTKKSKEQLCRELRLDVIIDDDKRHLTELGLPNLQKILIKDGSRKREELPNGVKYACSWKEVLELLL